MSGHRLFLVVAIATTTTLDCSIGSLPPRTNNDAATRLSLDAGKDSFASVDTSETSTPQADSNGAVTHDLGLDVPMDGAAAMSTGGASGMDGSSLTGGAGGTDMRAGGGGAGAMDAFLSTGGAGGADATLGTGGAAGTDGGPSAADAPITTADTRGADAPADAPIGGSIGTGGTTATGGTTSTGAIAGTGGIIATGGATSAGGTTGAGGTATSGGATGTGGTTGSGGGGASGDAAVDIGTACTWPNNVATWSDEFTSTTLDPAWNIWQYTGQRMNGQSAGTGHYSLTDNPGNLRYYVDPMIDAAPWDNYQSHYSGYYWYDPSLELSQELAGIDWTLELKVTWYVEPTANSAYHLALLHFDLADGQRLDYELARSVNSGLGYNLISLSARVDGSQVASASLPETAATTMQYVRFVRNNLTVTIRLSSDGSRWEDAFTYDLPADSLCVPHRLLLDSSAWFYPEGAYADYDYIHFTRRQ